jgi:hypothetical protein
VSPVPAKSDVAFLVGASCRRFFDQNLASQCEKAGLRDSGSASRSTDSGCGKSKGCYFRYIKYRKAVEAVIYSYHVIYCDSTRIVVVVVYRQAISLIAAHGRDKNTGRIPRELEFASGADFLKAFGLPLDGPSYRRAQDRFLRVFYSTWFFGKKKERRAKMFRVQFFDEIDLWFTKDLDTPPLPGEDFKNNRIVLSERFAHDLELHLQRLSKF